MAPWEDSESDGGEEPAVKPRKVMADTELDMTPMIDCTFLLLIFFTVAGKLDPSQAADLPQAKHGSQVDAESCVIVTVVQESPERPAKVFLSESPTGTPLPGGPDEIRAKVKEELEKGQSGEKKKSGLMIKAGRAVKSHEVANVAKAAGEIEGAKVYFAIMDTPE